RYQHAVDLVRALKDAIDTRITIRALSRIVGRIAIAAVNLHHLIGDEITGFRQSDFDDRTLGGVLLDAAQLRLRVLRAADCVLDETQRAIDQRLADPSSDRHLRELRLDRAERRDRPAELMPLVGVAHSLSNHQLHAARTHRAEFEAPEVQDVESDLRALADLAQ